MNSNSVNKAAMRRADNRDAVNSKSPDYDQSVRSQHSIAQANRQMQYNQQFNQGMYQSAFPMNHSQNNAWTPSDPNYYQMRILGTGNILSREQTMEEKKERMRQQLIRRKIPEDLWNYYLESPEHWNFEDATKEGLQKGIKAILM